MAEAMTYTSLLEDLSKYTERDDEPFLAQRARFVMMAENRIASEIRGLGYQRYATGTMNGDTLPKPARWRETISLNITTPTGRKFLFPRDYDYCRDFWPDPAQTDVPRYYADYGFEHFLFVPTPNSAYAFELAYHERPTPLDDANQTNWTTQYAPQLILYASLLEAQPFLKRPEFLQMWQPMYERASQAVAAEAQRNFTARTQTRNSP